MKLLRKKLSSIHEYFLDSFFPRQCVSCRTDGFWLCPDCEHNIPQKKINFCPHCERRTTPSGEICFECSKKSPLSGLLVSASYKQAVIKSLIHHAKYSCIEEIASKLGIILGKAFANSSFPLPDCIVPVPLHKRRLRWRGFNQSEIMARSISIQLVPEIGIPIISDGLTKIKHTKPQMSISSYQNRLTNAKNVYRVEKPERFFNKRILLIDDIATTGATITECARLLKECGAREVWGAVVARQELGKKQ